MGYDRAMWIYLKLVFVVLVRTCADVCFKAAVHQLDFHSFSSIFGNLRRMVGAPFLWIGLGLSVLNMLAWTSALENFDLSYAYPFLSVSYVTIIFSGWIFFNETLDRNKLIGIFFISLGAAASFLG